MYWIPTEAVLLQCTVFFSLLDNDFLCVPPSWWLIPTPLIIYCYLFWPNIGLEVAGRCQLMPSRAHTQTQKQLDDLLSTTRIVGDEICMWVGSRGQRVWARASSASCQRVYTSWHLASALSVHMPPSPFHLDQVVSRRFGHCLVLALQCLPTQQAWRQGGQQWHLKPGA